HIAAKAPDWGADAAKLHVIGPSAGAHLAAMMAAAPWPQDLPAQPRIASLGLLRGVYGLGPVLQVCVHHDIRLAAALAQRTRVMDFPPRSVGRVLVSYGTAEPAGWQAQSEDFHQGCRTAGTSSELLPVDGADHFDILYPLADATQPLGAALLRQCGLA